jgi:hypothetical protein
LSINPNRGVLNFTPKKAPSFLNESGISRPCSRLDVVNSKDDVETRCDLIQSNNLP